MTSTRFESELVDGEAVVAYFWSEGCQKCKAFAPSIETIMRSKGISLRKINVGLEPDFACQYSVVSQSTYPHIHKKRTSKASLKSIRHFQFRRH